MKLLQSVLLASLLLPAAVFAGEANKARIITSGEKPSECIASVHVNRIDNREVKVEELGFDIDSGTHTLSARARINTSFCKAVGIATGRHSAEPIEAEFEAGKTYWIGYDHSASNRRDWKLVIWKVEDSPQS
ncbi:hypothetical protein [Elongatibacter sediminis]|uniref:Uncharacterized protein n=1 Tax=Elongatibacter sediminis TaxID=3119006 RepID=A0AAW9RMP1_9GAMM